MKPEIVIAPLTVADAEAVVLVQIKTWLATYPNREYGVTEEDILSQTNTFTAERIIDRLQQANPKRGRWVSKINNQIVGFCYASKNEEYNELQAIYVLPEYQGAGVGNALMKTVLDWMGSDKEIRLGVVSYNEPAKRFYKKYGFVEYGPRHDEVAKLPSGKVLPEIEMRKAARQTE